MKLKNVDANQAKQNTGWSCYRSWLKN